MHEFEKSTLPLVQPIHENCPSCGKETVIEQTECFSCGIVFANYSRFQFEKEIKERIGGIDHLSVMTLKAIDQLWKKVVVNYHDQANHMEFINRCAREGAIPYAVHCYTRMLEIDDEDDVASHMRRQALGLLSANFVTPEPTVAPTYSRGVQWFKWVIWTGLLASVLLISLGSSSPQLRNLIGLGASLLVIFLFAFFYRRSYFA